MSIAFVHSPDEIRPEDIQSGNIWVADMWCLPFRIRIGEFYSLMTDPDVYVCLRNEIAVPDGRQVEIYTSQWREPWRMLTQAMVLRRSPELSAGCLDAVRRGEVPTAIIDFNAIQSLNDVIVAYLTALPTAMGIFSGRSVRLFNVDDALMSHTVSSVVVCRTGRKFTNTELSHLMSNGLNRSRIEYQSTHGQLFTDFQPGELEAIAPALRRHRSHVFYEYAVRAKIEAYGSEWFLALLMACVALEGAHGALLRAAGSKAMGADGTTDRLLGDLLREQGLYTMVQVTPRLFMKEAERPSPDLLKRCVEALTMRNDIMHAKYSKGGYKSRKHTMTQLQEGYAALNETYRYFVAALEARENLAEE